MSCHTYRMTLISYISMPVAVDGKTEWVKMNLSNGNVLVRGEDGVYRLNDDDDDDDDDDVDPSELVRTCKNELAKIKADGANDEYVATLENFVKRLEVN